jgi:hypothetical protein
MARSTTVRDRPARPAARSARLTAGDYVGQPAGEAAQAVRRAGLKPGLDRCFGHPIDVVGRVVEQDPEPGVELARNELVTLYVAAPSPVGVQESAAPEPEGEQAEPSDTRGATPQRSPRRRRKRRPADAETSEAAQGNGEPPSSSPSTEDTEWDEPPGEQFVVQAEDVFSGRRDRFGARRYPRRRARAGSTQRRLVVVALVAVAAWGGLALTGATTRGHAPVRPARVLPPSEPPTVTGRSARERELPRDMGERDIRRSSKARRPHSPRSTRAHAATAASASQTPPPTQVAPQAANTASAPAAARTGGLFSP